MQDSRRRDLTERLVQDLGQEARLKGDQAFEAEGSSRIRDAAPRRARGRMSAVDRSV